MNPHSIPDLARKLLRSLNDDRIRLSDSGEADIRAVGSGPAIVFENNGQSVAIPENRPSEGIVRTVHYSRVRPPQDDPQFHVVAIAPIPVEGSSPEEATSHPSRVGGHVTSPLPSGSGFPPPAAIEGEPPLPPDAENPAHVKPKVSKTGKGGRDWISGNEQENFWYDKQSQEDKKFIFLPDGAINPPNPNDKIPYELHWLGYGFWWGDWRKIPPINRTSTSTTTGLTTTTTTTEECAIEIVSILFNQKARHLGTYKSIIKITQRKPGTLPDPNDPYPIPPPSCEPRCVPDGPPVKGVGTSKSQWWFPLYGPNANKVRGPIFVGNQTLGNESTLFSQGELAAAVRSALGQYGDVVCGAGAVVRGNVQGGVDTSSVPFVCSYVAPYSFQSQKCTCNPVPPPPPPPPDPPIPPPPDPPGLSRTEEFNLEVDIPNLPMTPSFSRRFYWKESRKVNSTDGNVTSSIESRDIDCWIPLVKDSTGKTAIAVQIFQQTTVSPFPDPEVRYWWITESDSTQLSRAVFESILLKALTFKPYGVADEVIPLEKSKEARFNIIQRQRPVPDLIVTPSKSYLARVRDPQGTPQEYTAPIPDPPASKKTKLTVDFWQLPSGEKTSKKFDVKSLKIAPAQAIAGKITDYSYHPGQPFSPSPTNAP